MNKIIKPGDPEWDPKFSPVPQAPKLPDAVLEAAFHEAVQEVQDMISEGGPVSPPEVAQEAPVEAPTPGPPPVSYKFHRPARQRSFPIPVPKVIDATLLEDLPRRMERQCYVGDIEYVSVEGRETKMRVRRPGFKKGDHITLDSATFYPGIGVMYGFQEGSRGSLCVRPDQVHFELPAVADTPIPVAEPDQAQLPAGTEVQGSVQVEPVEVNNNATVDGQDPQV